MKYAKRTLAYFIVHTSIGLIALIIFLLGYMPEGYRQSMLTGIASGFLASGILGIIVSIRLIKNPKKAEKVELEKTEERTQFLRMKSNSATYSVSIYIECAGVFISGFLGFREVSITLAFLLIAQVISFVAFASYYGKKY
jgi:hypothetical protein